MTNKIPIHQLCLGDRFIFNENLWALVDIEDGDAIARKHSKESIALDKLGFGYHGDVVCSFGLDELVDFVPVILP